MQTNSPEELESLRLKELQQRYHQVVGEETRCPNRVFLVRRILAAAAVAAASPGTSPTASTAEAPRPSQGDSPLVQAVLAAGPPASGAASPQAGTTIDDAPPEDAEPSAPVPVPLTAVAVEAPPAPVQAPSEASEPEAGAPAATHPVVAPPQAPEASPHAEPPTETRAAPLEPWVPTDQELRTADTSSTAQPTRGRRGRFSGMTIAELQALYVAKVGRTTGSDDRRYLEWKIREAEKGHIPVGPREARAPAQEATSDVRILPLRLEASAVEALDAAWKSKGMKSRMELFRRALGHYLAHIGAPGAAAHFAGSHAT